MCAWYIGQGIEQRLQKATAVLGNSNLKNGQRINILKIAFQSHCSIKNSTCPRNDNDAAIIMVG